MCIKEIKSDNKLIAFIISKNYHEDGLRFVTDPEFPLQLAFIKNSKNSIVERHFHPSFNRVIKERMEFIFVCKGRLYIEFYDNNKNFLEGCKVSSGDSVFIASGGHSIKYLETSEIIELRLGPYNKKLDKVNF